MARTSIAILVCLVTIIGCKNQPSGPTSPATSTAMIVGTVILQSDEFGNPIDDQSGTIVTLDNGTDVLTATTATDGKWVVYNAPASVYTISAKRKDFSGFNTGDGNDTVKNVQYVGAGTFTAPSLRLAKAISPGMISDPTVDVHVTYKKDSTDPVHSVRRDTLVEVTVTFATKNTGQYDYSWGISDKPDPACDGFISSFYDRKSAEGGKVSMIILNASYKQLRTTFGENFLDRSLFVHVRPRFAVRTSNVSGTQPVCLPEVVAPFTF